VSPSKGAGDEAVAAATTPGPPSATKGAPPHETPPAAAATPGSSGRPAAAAVGRGASLEDPMKELELDMLVDDGNIYAIFGEDG
jgi:hypothetical protein